MRKYEFAVLFNSQARCENILIISERKGQVCDVMTLTLLRIVFIQKRESEKEMK